jgi:hypothetical protein
MPLFAELKRRNIFRVTLLYVTAGWLVLELTAMAVDYAGLAEWVYRFAFALLLIAFPLALLLSWFYEITPTGLRREKQVERAASITDQTGRRLVQLSGLAVVLVCGLNLLRFALD